MTKQVPLTQRDLLAIREKTFLEAVTYFEETDSTNSQAVELLSLDAEVQTPHLVYAERQVSGRGRGSNQWWSGKGSLTFSVIADFGKLGLSDRQKPLLPLLTGMAILRMGKTVLPTGDFSLKWPNDVYLAGRKVAGILIEVPAKPPGHAVIGIGLNVNNRFSDAPPKLQGTGISLSDLGQNHDRIEVLNVLLREFESLIESFVAGAPILESWPDHCLLTGKQVTLEVGNGDVSGVCCGIDLDGALLLESEHGRQRFLGGTVKNWI